MKYMMLIYADSTDSADPESRQKLMDEYVAFTQSIVDSKEFVAGDPLLGPETATVVRLRQGQLTTTDGPFVETKEHLGGYYVVDVTDLDRALEVAAQIPSARTGGIEVRPLLEMPALS